MQAIRRGTANISRYKAGGRRDARFKAGGRRHKAGGRRYKAGDRQDTKREAANIKIKLIVEYSKGLL